MASTGQPPTQELFIFAREINTASWGILPSGTILNRLRVREKCMTLPRRGGGGARSAEGAEAVISCAGASMFERVAERAASAAKPRNLDQ